jgi:branched-chain amino acid transport system substrate-binding protein
MSEYEKAYGKGSANQFAAHAFDVVIVLQKAVPIALKKGRPGTQEFRTALKDALETMGRTPVSQGVLNYTATDHFGYTPETGVLLVVDKGDWKLAPTK